MTRKKDERIFRLLFLSVIFIVLSLSVFVSCGEGESSLSEAANNELNSEGEELPYEVSIVKDTAGESSGISGNVTFMYPQIDYPENREAEDKINGLIKDLSSSVFKEAGLESEDIESYSYVTENALITLKRDNFFSAVVTGYYITDTASHQEYFSYSVNCDIPNERLLTSEEVIEDFSEIKNLFIEGRFAQSYGMDNLLDETSYSDMFTQYRADYSIYPDVYFTSSSFGIIVEIVYLFDGNACFEIEYADVKEYLRADLPVFK